MQPAPSTPYRRTAEAWTRHAIRAGARFAVATKAAQSAAFSATIGARGFALPTKLVGVKAHRAAVAALAPLVPLRLSVVRTGEGPGTPRVVASLPGIGLVGEIQPKHLPWLLPLVAARPHLPRPRRHRRHRGAAHARRQRRARGHRRRPRRAPRERAATTRPARPRARSVVAEPRAAYTIARA